MPNKISTNDRRALNTALSEIMNGPDVARRIQVAEMIKQDGWFYAAQCAAIVLQSQQLALRPWDIAPCQAEPDDVSPAGRLLSKMLAFGLSRFDIDPGRVLGMSQAS